MRFCALARLRGLCQGAGALVANAERLANCLADVGVVVAELAAAEDDVLISGRLLEHLRHARVHDPASHRFLQCVCREYVDLGLVGNQDAERAAHLSVGGDCLQGVISIPMPHHSLSPTGLRKCRTDLVVAGEQQYAFFVVRVRQHVLRSSLLGQSILDYARWRK